MLRLESLDRSLAVTAAFVVLAATAMLAAVPGRCQERSEEPIGRVEEELQVIEVLLDVLVTGPEGHVIIGLGKEDFVVEENGEPVEIESVSFYSNRRLRDLAGLAAQASGAAPEDRYFVLFFYRPPIMAMRDLSLVKRLPRAGRHCLDWIARDLLPNDFVSIVTFDGALNLVQDFTADPARLELAIRKTVSGKAPKRHWPSRADEPVPGISLAHLQEDNGLRDRTDDLFTAITELANSLGGVTGRKNLILLGADFPAAGSDLARRGYEPMIEALNTHNVAAYAVDIAGRGRQPTPGRVADATGGRYSVRGGDVLGPLRQIERETNGFYLLSYRSTHPEGDSGYRQIEVKTANPELKARARSGYRFGG